MTWTRKSPWEISLVCCWPYLEYMPCPRVELKQMIPLHRLDLQWPRTEQTAWNDTHDISEGRSYRWDLPSTFPLHISAFGYLLVNLYSSAQPALAALPTQLLVPCFPPEIQPVLHELPGSWKEISSVQNAASLKHKVHCSSEIIRWKGNKSFKVFNHRPLQGKLKMGETEQLYCLPTNGNSPLYTK